MAASIGSLTAQNTFSSPATSTSAQRLSLSISGTWAGTLTLQRSFDNGSTYMDVQAFTANTEAVVENAGDAAVLWRVGFKTGNYTSGTAAVRLQ